MYSLCFLRMKCASVFQCPMFGAPTHYSLSLKAMHLSSVPDVCGDALDIWREGLQHVNVIIPHSSHRQEKFLPPKLRLSNWFLMPPLMRFSKRSLMAPMRLSKRFLMAPMTMMPPHLHACEWNNQHIQIWGQPKEEKTTTDSFGHRWKSNLKQESITSSNHNMHLKIYIYIHIYIYLTTITSSLYVWGVIQEEALL